MQKSMSRGCPMQVSDMANDMMNLAIMELARVENLLYIVEGLFLYKGTYLTLPRYNEISL